MTGIIPPWEAIGRFDMGDWWKDESLPVSFDKYYPARNISVEVGFGHGEFLHMMAKSNREDLFIGVEHFGEGLRKLVRSLRAENTFNCLPLNGDGFIILQVVFNDGALSDVYVNFPDPWPKARHKNKRLFVEEFFSLASRKLKAGGKLHLATDHAPLAEQAMEEAANVKTLRNINDPAPCLRKSPYPFSTRYERKWMNENRGLFYFTFERT